MKEIFNVGDEVYFTPKAKFGNIIMNNTLYELRPKKGIIYNVECGESIFGGELYCYKIKMDKYFYITYENIHTCYKNIDDYYDGICKEIIDVSDRNESTIGKVKKSLIKFFKIS